MAADPTRTVRKQAYQGYFQNSKDLMPLLPDACGRESADYIIDLPSTQRRRPVLECRLERAHLSIIAQALAAIHESTFTASCLG